MSQPPPPPVSPYHQHHPFPSHQHQQQQQQQRVQVPIFQCYITKLRSWRTGYTRILALYEHELVTYDPTECIITTTTATSHVGTFDSDNRMNQNDTNTTTTITQNNDVIDYPYLRETNRYPYVAIQDWLALPTSGSSSSSSSHAGASTGGDHHLSPSLPPPGGSSMVPITSNVDLTSSHSNTTITTTTTMTTTTHSNTSDPNYQCILLQMENGEKLKFQIHPESVSRAIVLTYILQQQDQSGQADVSKTTLTFANCERISSLSSSSSSSSYSKQQQYQQQQKQRVMIQVKPYGILELDPSTLQTIQIHYYIDICGVSLLYEEEHGIIFYFNNNTIQKTISYNIITSHTNRMISNANGRSDFLKAIQTWYQTLGLHLPMQPRSNIPNQNALITTNISSSGIQHDSYSLRSKQQQQQQQQQSAMSHSNNITTTSSCSTSTNASLQKMIGPIIAVWNVTKPSKRKQSQSQQQQSQSQQQQSMDALRRLAITSNGYVVELDNNDYNNNPTTITTRTTSNNNDTTIISVHRLCDIRSILRIPDTQQITIEYYYYHYHHHHYSGGGGGGGGGGCGMPFAETYTILQGQRDACIVAFLDAAGTTTTITTTTTAASQSGNNAGASSCSPNVTLLITDPIYSTVGYSLIHHHGRNQFSTNSTSSATTTTISEKGSTSSSSRMTGFLAAAVTASSSSSNTVIPTYLIKRIHTISTQTYAILSSEYSGENGDGNLFLPTATTTTTTHHHQQHQQPQHQPPQSPVVHSPPPPPPQQQQQQLSQQQQQQREQQQQQYHYQQQQQQQQQYPQMPILRGAVPISVPVPLPPPQHPKQSITASTTTTTSTMPSLTTSNSHLMTNINRRNSRNLQQLLTECHSIVLICREFNASTLSFSTSPSSSGLFPSKLDSQIMGSLGALWGLIGIILTSIMSSSSLSGSTSNSTQQHLHQSVLNAAFDTAGTILQTIYRFCKLSPKAYKSCVELTTMTECIPLVLLVGMDNHKTTIENDHWVMYQFWALQVLNVLMSGKSTSNKQQRDQEAEFVNKNVIMRYGGLSLINGIVSAMLSSEDEQQQQQQQQKQSVVKRKVSDLILMVASDILQSVLCSYYETTTPEVYNSFITALSYRYRALLATLHFANQSNNAVATSITTPFVLENTALLLHLLSTHAPTAATAIRDAALSSGIVLHYLYLAIFGVTENQRFISRYLCTLWFTGPMECEEKRLLKRIVPCGFFPFLNMPILSQIEEQQLDEIERDNYDNNDSRDNDSNHVTTETASAFGHFQQYQGSDIGASAGMNSMRLRARMTLATATLANRSDGGIGIGHQAHGGGHQYPIGAEPKKSENFRIFFHVLTQDHNLADLIWSQQTRQELRIALESELQYIRREIDAHGGDVDKIAWNYQQFHVSYPSLEQNEVKVGDVYMRLWLQAGDAFIRSWDEPVRLFEHLFRRFLCEINHNTNITVMCIRCMERLYAIHAKKIGPFDDAILIVRYMSATKSIEIQHRLLGLLATILGVTKIDSNDDKRYDIAEIPENAEQLLNVESISLLCQFVAWGHTNGDQIVNVLARSLGIGMAPMITDGGGFGEKNGSLDGANSNDPGKLNIVADGICCPKVWFVAQTGRVPPPPESIRGPYRVSDLVRMMQEGDLTPYDLVTTAHVEEYDAEEDYSSETVKEAHIDTGKWKRLNQVWQLRWQLCTDGSKSVLYSPSDVSLLALKALTRLIDIHKSFDSRGVIYFPIPTAKRILSRTSRDTSFSTSMSTTSAVAEATNDVVTTSPLSVICQSFLCNDPRIVDVAADLVFKLTEHNPQAMSKLYLTGIFFFTCCYTGSNFRMLAKLLAATHLRQNFRSGFKATADETQLPMNERSILGHMIPDGLLFILTNYGPDRFAEIFVGNADTPECIWTFEMRKHLIEMVRQHLGDFPLRLFQNTTTEYEYCPMPGVAYKRLEKEIFCHNYYLHNLCDEARFPEWPIAEPVEVFRACLERFRQCMDRNRFNEEQVLEKARQVLSLQAGDGSKELRRAYRRLARKYHPDKNPAGREKFEEIQSALQTLLPLVENGESIRIFVEEEGDMSNDKQQCDELFPSGKAKTQIVHLLIKTQLLICRRYENSMSRHKYPAYNVLLTCCRLPADQLSLSDDKQYLQSPLVKLDRAIFTRSATELIFTTCLISPLNAEELIIESGISMLASLLHFYIKVALSMKVSSVEPGDETSTAVAPINIIAEIISNIVHTLAGVAYFKNGRAAIWELTDTAQFLLDWRRCLDGSLFSNDEGKILDSSMKQFCLEGITNMARDEGLQNLLVRCGVVWPLLRCILLYDPTLAEATESSDDLDDTYTSAASINVFARLAVRALGMLSGSLDDAPKNPSLLRTLSRLLTDSNARMLRNKRTSILLRILNSNVERPDIIWNLEMRNQLESLLLKIDEDKKSNVCLNSTEEALLPADKFSFNFLANEVRIGGVYVRVFCKGGKESLSNVPNPNAFLDAIIHFIAKSINESKHISDWVDIATPRNTTEKESDPCSGPSDLAFSPLDSNAFLLAMDALRILCRVEGLIEDALCQASSVVATVLLSLLELPLESKVFDIGLEVLSTLSPKQFFADAVSSEGSFWRLLQLLERPEPNEKVNNMPEGTILSDNVDATKRTIKGWSILEALTSSMSIASEIISSMEWIELLGVLVGYAEFTKVWTARVGAAKTLSRLMWDPKIGSQAVKLKEDPEGMLKSFDSTVDNPELIWDSSMRGELRSYMGELLDGLIVRRKEKGGGTEKFCLAHDMFVKYPSLENELYIGGVYISRFLKDPTFNLRDPTNFLELLIQRWMKELEIYTSSVGGLSSAPEQSHAMINAGDDVLQLVTDAVVYICKVRDSLCDRLGSWGYMPICVDFMESLLARNLVGTPLISVIRVLHVAAGRLTNVEALALVGKTDGKQGVVDFSLKSIGFDDLHNDTSFIIEFLKKTFITALGDVTNVLVPHHKANILQSTSVLAMAPSPAPGHESVREKVSAGDDPLAMLFQTSLQPVTNVSTSQHPNPSLETTHSQQDNFGPHSLPHRPPYHQGHPLSSFSHNSLAIPNATSGTFSCQHQQPQMAMPRSSQHYSHWATVENTAEMSSNPEQLHIIGNALNRPHLHHQAPSTNVASSVVPPLSQSSIQDFVPSLPAHEQFSYRTGRIEENTVNQMLPKQHLNPSMLHRTMFSSQPSSPQVAQLHQPHHHQQTIQQPFTPQQLVRSQHMSPPHAQGITNVPPNSTNAEPRSSQSLPSTHPQVIQYGSQPSQLLPSSSGNVLQQCANDFQESNASRSLGTTIPQNSHAFHPSLSSGHRGGTIDQHSFPVNPIQPCNHESASSTYLYQPSGVVPFHGLASSHQHGQERSQNSQPWLESAVQQSPPQTMTGGFPQILKQANEIPSQVPLTLGNTSFISPPTVETTLEPRLSSENDFRSIGIHGSGVDARTLPDPSLLAEEQVFLSGGAPGAARGRVSLLNQALACKLCEFLISFVLENPNLSKVRDPASAKVYTIDLIKLLTKDPGFGPKFTLILNEIPEWKKYKSQDHSLLIMGHEQKADYFLTNGCLGTEKQLLTEK